MPIAATRPVSFGRVRLYVLLGKISTLREPFGAQTSWFSFCHVLFWGGWVGGCKIPAVVDLFFLTQGPERDQFIRNPVPPRTSRLPAGSSMAFSIWWLQSQDADELRWLYSFGVPRGPSTFSEGTWTLQTCITVSPITF